MQDKTYKLKNLALCQEYDRLQNEIEWLATEQSDADDRIKVLVRRCADIIDQIVALNKG